MSVVSSQLRKAASLCSRSCGVAGLGVFVVVRRDVNNLTCLLDVGKVQCLPDVTVVTIVLNGWGLDVSDARNWG